MGIIVRDGGGSFTPHPEGQFSAVCVDVHDIGEIETQWGMKHKVDIFFYSGIQKTDEHGNQVTGEDGRPFYIFVRSRFTATLSDKGNLRPFLEQWRGKKFTPDELKGFDLENLIGAPAFLQISHNTVDSTTYANIDTIMKLPKSETAPEIPADYVRFCDREQEHQDEDGSPPPIPTGAYPDEDSLPF